MSEIININDESFEKLVLNQKGIVLVDFWATWCGPCKLIAPIVEEIAKEYENKIKVYKFDVDMGNDIPTKFMITSIPTLILFKDGKPIDKIVGAVSKNKIKDMINSAL